MSSSDGRYDCSRCGRSYAAPVGGIVDLLPAERAAAFMPFLSSYTRIRQAEGRGSERAAYYEALPGCDSRDPLAWQWRIRARSYEALAKIVLARLPGGAKVLDLGAGAGWLSHRLAEAGCAPCAVDVNVDPHDGLGAARHYRPRWPRVRAEFDRLPLADSEADAVVYNGAFHYSADYETTLREALRVLRPGGIVAILDSPVYTDRSSGERMLAEQARDFETRFGERSDSLGNVGFLTWRMLDELGGRLGLRWQVHVPWYGFRWWLRRPLARLRGHREPARFALIWGCRWRR